MLLETGGDMVRFKPRPLGGVKIPPNVTPKNLILDGQQRLTSLFLTLKSGRPVATKTETGQAIERIYFLDIAKCLKADEDRLEAVVSIPSDRKITSDFGRKVE